MKLSESYIKRLQELAAIPENNLLQIEKSDLLSTKLYHGTTAEKWKKGYNHYLFVTDAKDLAIHHAMQWIENGNDLTPIVVQIDTKDIINYEWEADDDDGRYPFKTWQESYKQIGAFVVVGNLDIDNFPIIWKYSKPL